MRRYAFARPWKRWLAAGLDPLGELLLGASPPLDQPPWGPGRTLVLRLDQLGDVVQTLPFFDALADLPPGGPVEVLTTPAGAELLQGHPQISRVHAWSCPWFHGRRLDPGAFQWLTDFLRRGSYRRTVHLRGDLFPLLCAWWAGIPERIGYAPTGGRFLLTHSRDWQPEAHAVRKNLALAELLGARCAGPLPLPRLPGRTGPPARGETPGSIALHPDAGAPAKLWPESHWVELMALLLERTPADLELVGLDRERGERLLAGLRERVPGGEVRITNRMGRTSLPELVEVLARVRLLVTPDSGPGHLAAALGLPVVVLFSGVASSSVWRPLGKRVTLLEVEVPCAPCSLRSCPVEGHPCLRGLSPARVVRAVEESWKRG